MSPLPEDAPPVSRRRRLVQRLVLLTVSVCLAVLIMEGAARVYVARRYPRIRGLDETLGWRLLPDTARTRVNEDGVAVTTFINAEGRRGRLLGPESAAGHRILLLGDSFMEGTQVEVGELMARGLEREVPGVEVVNAGCGAYGTVQQFLYLRHEGLALKPDTVLLAVYDNDFTDNCVPYYAGIGPRPFARLVEGRVKIEEEIDDERFLAFCMPFPGRSFLFRHSQLYRSINKNLWQARRGPELQELERRDAEHIDEASRRHILLGVVDRMAAATSSAESTLALVLLPTREQVRGEPAPRLEAVQAHCAGRSLPCFSLLEPLRRERAAGHRLYFEKDIHWTREGHAAAARALGPFLAKLRERGR